MRSITLIDHDCTSVHSLGTFQRFYRLPLQPRLPLPRQSRHSPSPSALTSSCFHQCRLFLLHCCSASFRDYPSLCADLPLSSPVSRGKADPLLAEGFKLTLRCPLHNVLLPNRRKGSQGLTTTVCQCHCDRYRVEVCDVKVINGRHRQLCSFRPSKELLRQWEVSRWWSRRRSS